MRRNTRVAEDKIERRTVNVVRRRVRVLDQMGRGMGEARQAEDGERKGEGDLSENQPACKWTFSSSHQAYFKVERPIYLAMNMAENIHYHKIIKLG